MSFESIKLDTDNEGFTSSKRKGKKRRVRSRSPRQLLDEAIADLASEGGGAWLTQVDRDLKEFREFADMTSGVKTILCLGLGSPSSSSVARAQLALLMHMREYLGLSTSEVSIYDPVFTPEDENLMKELEFVVLPNEKFDLEERTLVFMPHCELSLYEQLWSSNWTDDRISRVLLLGNDQRGYTSRVSARSLAGERPCVHTISDHLQSKALPQYRNNPLAFNNTAFQAVQPGFICRFVAAVSDDTNPQPQPPLNLSDQGHENSHTPVCVSEERKDKQEGMERVAEAGKNMTVAKGGIKETSRERKRV